MQVNTIGGATSRRAGRAKRVRRCGVAGAGFVYDHAPTL